MLLTWTVVVFGVWLAAAVAYQLLAMAFLARLIAPRRDGSREPEIDRVFPSCTILSPQEGHGPRIEEQLEALRRLGAPIVIGVAEPGAPAVAVVERLQARYPQARLQLSVGAGPAGGNRKVAKLVQMLPAAGGDIVVFCDGDVSVGPGDLEAVLAPFADPAVGLVTCPYRTVSGKTLVDRLDALLTNTVFLPSVALAVRLEGVRFGLGAMIAVRRRVLEAIGGLEPLLNRLADDYMLAATVAEAGHRVALAPVLLDHCSGERQTLGEIWRRHVRWARTVRSVRRLGYYGTIVTHGLPAALGLAATAGETALLAAAPLALWVGVRTAGIAPYRSSLALAWRDLLLVPLADLLAFAVYVSGGMRRAVIWSGLRLRIGPGSVIEAVEPLVKRSLRVKRKEMRSLKDVRLAARLIYRRLLVSLVEASQQRAGWVLMWILVSTGALFWYAATHLSFDTKTSNLLAPQLPFRQLEADFERAFPQLTDLIVVVIDASSADRAEKAADQLAAALRRQPELFHSVYQPGRGPFFERHGLLYLDTAELWELDRQLTDWAPFLGAPAEDSSLRGFFSVLRLALEHPASPGHQEILARVFRWVGDTIEAQLSKQASRGFWHEALVENMDIAADAGRRFLLAKPRVDYSRLQAADEPVIALRRLVEEIEDRENVQIRLTGSVVLEQEERNLVAQSAGFAAAGAFLLVCLLLMLGLRSLRLTAAILVTLSVGLIWTAAFATFAIGSLNLISATAPILFIGLGVDFGIQFAMRYRYEREGGIVHVEALRRAADGIGLALTLAALAAALSFFSFLPTSYRGLAELGLIAAAGMAIALVANLTVLPALLTVLPLPRSSEPARYRFPSLFPILITRHRRAVLAIALLTVGIALVLLPQVRFDFNPLNLKNPAMESVRTFQELLSDPDTTPYTIEILADDLRAARELADRLEALPEVSKAITLASYVPADQAEKLAIIDDLALALQPITMPVTSVPPPGIPERLNALRAFQDQLARVSKDGLESSLAASLARLGRLLTRLEAAPGWPEPALLELEERLVGDLPEGLEQLRRLLTPDRVIIEDLPSSLKSRYIAPDGRARVEVFPSEVLASDQALRRFVRAVQSVAPTAIGAPVEILEGGAAVVRASLQATGLAVLAGAVLLILALGNLRDTMLVFLPLVLTAILTGASSAVLGVSLNLANLVARPLLLGLGKAFGIYLIMRKREGLDTDALCRSSTCRAVLFSALTTMASFGTLAFADHRGMSSMGLLLSLTLGFALLCALVVLPALMAEMERWRGRRR